MKIIIDESYREQQEHQSRISNKSFFVGCRLLLTEVTSKITETKKLMQVEGARRDREQVSSKFYR